MTIFSLLPDADQLFALGALVTSTGAVVVGLLNRLGIGRAETEAGEAHKAAKGAGASATTAATDAASARDAAESTQAVVGQNGGATVVEILHEIEKLSEYTHALSHSTLNSLTVIQPFVVKIARHVGVPLPPELDDEPAASGVE